MDLVNNKNKGFTLVELLVVISIFAIMTTVGIFSFRSYEDATELNNLALDIALFIRRAQAVGIAGADVNFDPEAPTETDPTGIFFENNGTSLSNTMILYRDVSPEGGSGYNYYNAGDIVLDQATVPSSGELSFYRWRASPPLCQKLNVDVSVNFLRPRPEPHVYTGTGNALNLSPVFGITEIVSGIEKFIIIENTGQIRVVDDLGVNCN